MKKYLLSLLTFVVAAFVSVNLVSCGDDDDEVKASEQGSIYGMVTILGSTDPVKGVGVKLYKMEGLYWEDGDWDCKSATICSSSTTFDDGHFEFADLLPGDYYVDILADGYELDDADDLPIRVEAGRQTKVDYQMVKSK